MEEFEKLESLIDHCAAYTQTRIEEARLNLAEKSTSMIAFLVTRVVIATVFGVCLLFLSAAGAIAWGEHLGHEWLGFLLTGGCYFVLGWIVVAARHRLIRLPVMNTLIHQLFKKSHTDEKN